MAVAEEVVFLLNSKVDQAIKGFQATGKSVETLEKNVAKSSKAMQDQSKAIGSAFKALSAAIGIAGVQAIADFAKRAADFEEQSDALSKKFGVDTDKLLKDLNKAADGQISNYDLIKTSSTALAKNVVSDQTQLAKILEFTTAKSDEWGISATEAYNRVVEGIATGSPKILKQLGIGTEQLSKFGDEVEGLVPKEKLLNIVLDSGSKYLEAIGDNGRSTADKIARMGASFDNLKDTAGKGLLLAFAGPLETIDKFIDKSVDLKKFGDIAKGVFIVIKLALTPVTAEFRILSEVIIDIVSTAIQGFRSLATIIEDFRSGSIKSFGDFKKRAGEEFDKFTGKMKENAKGLKDTAVSILQGAADDTKKLYDLIVHESVEGEKKKDQATSKTAEALRKQREEEANANREAERKKAYALELKEVKDQIEKLNKLHDEDNAREVQEELDKLDDLKASHQANADAVIEIDARTQELRKKLKADEVKDAKAIAESILENQENLTARDLEDRIAAVKELAALYQGNADVQMELDKKIYELKKDLNAKIVEDAKTVIGVATTLADDAFQIVKIFNDQIVNESTALYERLHEIESEYSETKRQREQEDYDLQVQNLQQEIADAVSKNDEKTAADKRRTLERLQQDKEYNDKHAELEKQANEQANAEKLKQFQAQKDAATAQAIISGALAVANGLATVPFIPAGLIAAGSAAAAAGIQIAAIQSQKPPAFASGTAFAPGGRALVGELGPEYVNLPRGSQVLPASVTAGLLPDSGGRSVGSTSIDNRRFNDGRVSNTNHFYIQSPDPVDLSNQLQKKYGVNINRGGR